MYLVVRVRSTCFQVRGNSTLYSVVKYKAVRALCTCVQNKEYFKIWILLLFVLSIHKSSFKFKYIFRNQVQSTRVLVYKVQSRYTYSGNRVTVFCTCVLEYKLVHVPYTDEYFKIWILPLLLLTTNCNRWKILFKFYRKCISTKIVCTNVL